MGLVSWNGWMLFTNSVNIYIIETPTQIEGQKEVKHEKLKICFDETEFTIRDKYLTQRNSCAIFIILNFIHMSG